MKFIILVFSKASHDSKVQFRRTKFKISYLSKISHLLLLLDKVVQGGCFFPGGLLQKNTSSKQILNIQTCDNKNQFSSCWINQITKVDTVESKSNKSSYLQANYK